MAAEQTEKTAKALNLSLQRLLEEHANIALFNPQDLFHPDGRPKTLMELDERTARALASVDIKGKLKDGVDPTYKFIPHNKQSSLDSIARLLGYNPQTGATAKLEFEDPKKGEKKYVITLNLGK